MDYYKCILGLLKKQNNVLTRSLLWPCNINMFWIFVKDCLFLCKGSIIFRFGKVFFFKYDFLMAVIKYTLNKRIYFNSNLSQPSYSYPSAQIVLFGYHRVRYRHLCLKLYLHLLFLARFFFLEEKQSTYDCE